MHFFTYPKLRFRVRHWEHPKFWHLFLHLKTPFPIVWHHQKTLFDTFGIFIICNIHHVIYVLDSNLEGYPLGLQLSSYKPCRANPMCAISYSMGKTKCASPREKWIVGMWLKLIGSIRIDYTMTTYMLRQVCAGPGAAYRLPKHAGIQWVRVILCIYGNYRRSEFRMVNGTYVPYFIIWNGI